MASVARVDVTLADVEPVASFITRILAADALFESMTPLEAASLPGVVAEAVAAVQGAVRDLAAPPVCCRDSCP